MKKRKLKGFVLPTLYLLITISIFTSIIFIGSSVNLKEKDYDYGTGTLKDIVESVMVEDEITSSIIENPVSNENVQISIHYYSKDKSEEEQQASLIFYENTYIPNTGVLYTSDESFEVKSVFSGKVSEILDDEFFGKYIVIEHTPTLRTYYYGLEDIKVQAGEEITSKTVLGISKNNAIANNKKSCLIEVYHNNEHIDPETMIGKKITDYN